MKELLIFLFLMLGLNKIIGQEYFYNRYSISNPISKKVNSLTIHDNLLNRDSIYKIKADFLDFSNFRYAEYVNSRLYVLFHNNNKPSEIWQLTDNASKLILSGYHISSFSISPNNEYIAINDTIARICKINGKTISKITSISPIDASVYVYGWASDNDLIWFYRSGPSCYVDSIYSYRLNKKELMRYSIPADFCEFSINTDRSLFLYCDFPNFCSAEEITMGNPKSFYYLYLYDFITGEKKLLRQNIGKAFSPNWIDKDNYEYFDKKSNKRLKTKI